MHQFIHSLDLHTGGVCEAVIRLNEELTRIGFEAKAIDCPKEAAESNNFSIAHGLWQWPGVVAYQNWKRRKIPFLVFPHGMLDPWFKTTFPLKHFKKQLYWWWRQGRILSNAHAVCFTTEDEMQLAQNTFRPYKCREIVTGLGVCDPPKNEEHQKSVFVEKFPMILDKKVLLYMGRLHPKKGLDLLLNAIAKNFPEDSVLVIAGPVDQSDPYVQKLQDISKGFGKKVLWTDMLEGDLKWGALGTADALILPSHQENYGMVVAEACSVGTPVLTTNKVNLHCEILEYEAGIVEDDTQRGIDNLVLAWIRRKHQHMQKNALRCFQEKLHISNTARKIVDLFNEVKETSPQ